MLSLLSVLCLFSVWAKGAEASDHQLPFMAYLDHNRLVCLKWGFDNRQGNITLKLTVNTTGWVSFGFSPNGGMKGSDIVMGGVGSTGVYFTDRHATGNTMPVVDEQQSYTLLSMTESNGQTIMHVQRTIQSCDDDQDFHITEQPIKVIYAYGTTDEISYHGARRGTKELDLLNHMPSTTPTNLKFLSAMVENITIPPITTYYHCKVMKFPTLETKHHIYQIEPVIEHADIVHHMLLYGCPSFVTEAYDNPCYRGDVGDACYGVTAVWGVGGGKFEFPENVGLPFGGPDNDRFFRLEIHYDNPRGESGRTDSSGLKLHYTDQLREHDVAILPTGVDPFSSLPYNIPPKATEFRSYGVCNTSLFSQLIKPVPELKVFAVMLHTHTAGKKVRVALYRNKMQVDFLGMNENYDFDLQQSQSLGTIKTIKPGDEIAVECTYSTRDRTKVTKMGLATTDEMCLAFLLYYPATKIISCVSRPDTRMSEDVTTSDQDAVAAQETLLKTLPQIQVVGRNDDNFSVYPHGIIRNMKKTPTVTCPNTTTTNRSSPSWTVNPAGILLLLLCFALM